MLRVRGDGHRYKFTVRTKSGFDTPIYQYQCAFTTKRDEWEEHRLPFKDFVPTFRGRVLTDVPPERYEGGRRSGAVNNAGPSRADTFAADGGTRSLRQ